MTVLNYLLAMICIWGQVSLYTQGKVTAVAGEQFEKINPYLGQEPPGMEPRVFAPGIVSTPEALEIGCAWSPDGREFYFVRQSPKGGQLLVVERDDQQVWSKPRELEHFKSFPGFEPFVSPNGRTFFYTRMIPPDGAPESHEPVTEIWKMMKTGTAFGKPERCTPGMFCSTARNGNLYLTRVTGDRQGICVLKPIPEIGYGGMEYLRGGVNEPVMGAHPCIDPEEQFIIFDSKRGGDPENADLFVCFRHENGEWSEAVSLGESINTPWNDLCPALSPDGKYLFYMSKADIYWVSMDVIAALEQKEGK